MRFPCSRPAPAAPPRRPANPPPFSWRPPSAGRGVAARSRTPIDGGKLSQAGRRPARPFLRYSRWIFVRRWPGLGRPVAHAADRLDQPLVLGAELRPKPADVDVHGPGTAVEVVAPYLLEQRASGEHPLRPLDQESKQLEL